MDKWYGESNKIVDAIFSLSNKIEPCIIFIDEIDSFLRERSSMDHEVTASLKAEFMTLWDGLLSNGRILVVGATNRIADIDSAFLRRLPKRFYVSLPGFEQRKKVLEVEPRDTDLDEENFSIDAIAEATQGLSGSDRKELCREAAMVAAKEYIRKKRALLFPRKDGTTLTAVSSEQAVDGEGGSYNSTTENRGFHHIETRCISGGGYHYFRLNMKSKTTGSYHCLYIHTLARMINSEAVLSFLFSSRDLSFPRKKKGETKLDPPPVFVRTTFPSISFLASLYFTLFPLFLF